MILERDGLMVLLERLDRRSYSVSPDLVNGHGFRWVASGVSVQSLVTTARQRAASHEDTQLCHFQICALDGGSLEPIEIESLDTPEEPTTRCRVCQRDLALRYFGTVMKTGDPLLTCLRCQDAAESKMPSGRLTTYSTRVSY